MKKTPTNVQKMDIATWLMQRCGLGAKRAQQKTVETKAKVCGVKFERKVTETAIEEVESQFDDRG